MGLCSNDKATIEAQAEEIGDLKLAILNAALEVTKRDRAIEQMQEQIQVQNVKMALVLGAVAAGSND